ncbi:hypothetical protein KAJ27_21895 [bacterium]|nr:hypothetical protein [bacterium]
MNSFKFVFASNDGIELNSLHFGDSKIFYIYEIHADGTIAFEREFKNEFQDIDEMSSHGSKVKRQSIISLLGKDINFIISNKMSPNFVKINKNTKVCPIVSEIKNIDKIIGYLKSNFQQLEKIMKSKSDNQKTEILKIQKR